MQQYQIILKNEKVNQYNRIAQFIIIANIAIFVLLAVESTTKKWLIYYSTVSAIISVILIIDYFFPFNKYWGKFELKLAALAIISISWFNSTYWWVGIIIILLDIFYTISKRLLLLTITKKEISYPSIPQKKIKWSTVNNVILKDGLLTIDLKTNRLIQQAVEESQTVVNEKQFNDFCREQLSQ